MSAPPDPSTVPAPFVTNCPPVIRENTFIVAAAHPNYAMASPSWDGSFVSDLYAHNYLYKGLGARQTWLTAADPRELVRKYGSYLYGDRLGHRKVVLSQNMLGRQLFTPVTVVDQSKIVKEFLVQVSEASAKARTIPGGNLLILLFCHGIPTFEFELGGKLHDGLRVNQLLDAIGESVAATLVTNASYPDGWLVDPMFNYPRSALTDRYLPLAGSSPRSPSCAFSSAFIGTVIATLTSTNSDLLVERSESENTVARKPLQPTNPTTQQTEAYNNFCRAIWEACDPKLSRNVSDGQHFSFAKEDDEWQKPGCVRNGIPLVCFAERWNFLEEVTSEEKPPSGLNRGPSPFHPFFFEDAHVRPIDSDFIEVDGERTSAAIAPHYQQSVSRTIAIFRECCAGIWGISQDSDLRSFLAMCAATAQTVQPACGDERYSFIKSTFHPHADTSSANGDARVGADSGLDVDSATSLEGDYVNINMDGNMASRTTAESDTSMSGSSPDISTVDYFNSANQKDAVAIIRFSVEQAMLMDHMILCLGLQRPHNTSCLTWNIGEWRARNRGWWREHNPHYDFLYGRFTSLLRSVGLSLKTHPRQGPELVRPIEYMSAVLYMYVYDGHNTAGEIVAKLDAFGQYMRGMKQLHLNRVLENDTVWQRGRQWLQSIGHQARQQPSQPAMPGSSLVNTPGLSSAISISGHQQTLSFLGGRPRQ